MPIISHLPKPALPYSGSLDKEPGGGWTSMKRIYGWRWFPGDSKNSYFIARPDAKGGTKAEIVENGILNVHYFYTTNAAVHWYNSYQIR
jgi:hypothetical protein